MDQFKAMTIFVSIVENGSLTAAADKMDCSTAAIVRALAALEQRLGIRLINRNTRNIAVTAEGDEYYVWCKHILNELQIMDDAFDAKVNRHTGLLKISAPIEFGSKFISPMVNQYLRENPASSIQLILNDRYIDLMQDRFDLAFRIGHLPDSNLIATSITDTQWIQCASPEYLKTISISHPNDLSICQCIVFLDFGRKWKFSDQQLFSVDVASVLATNQIRVAKKACMDGVGIAQFFRYQVSDELKTGALVEILSAYQLPPVPIQLVYPHKNLLSPRVAHFIDWFKAQQITWR